MIDPSKYDPWIPPTVPTIYSDPIDAIDEYGASVTVYSVETRSRRGIISTDRGSFAFAANLYTKKQTPPPRRMTNIELAILMSKGDWLELDENGWMHTAHAFRDMRAHISVHSDATVQRIGTTEWIQPTTDLLEQNQ